MRTATPQGAGSGAFPKYFGRCDKRPGAEWASPRPGRLLGCVQADNPFDSASAYRTELLVPGEHDAVFLRPVVSARLVVRAFEGAHADPSTCPSPAVRPRVSSLSRTGRSSPTQAGSRRGSCAAPPGCRARRLRIPPCATASGPAFPARPGLSTSASRDRAGQSRSAPTARCAAIATHRPRQRCNTRRPVRRNDGRTRERRRMAPIGCRWRLLHRD